MLAPEEGKRRLAAFAVPDPHTKRQARAKGLPPALRALADDLLLMSRREHPAHWGTPAGHAWRIARAADLDALAVEDRRRVFAVLFPAIADDVERGWRALVGHPYQSSFARRAFRAPRHPPYSADKRVTWLFDLVDVVALYEQDVVWLATWTGHFHFPWRCDAIGRLLATVIDAGGPCGEEVLRILLATAEGGHEIAVFDRYVVRGLASCARREAWACLERLLLRAQREEGLRQVILETVDEAHPECFRRVVAAIAEHGLARFSAVARAVDVRLAMQWDSDAAKHVASIAERLARYLPDPAARAAAIASDVAEDAYLGLYAAALEDAVAAAERARPLLGHARAEVRYAAAYLLAELGHSRANAVLVGALGDADRRVAARAVEALAGHSACEPPVPDLFERLEAELARWPARKAKEPAILWPWCVHELDRADVGRALLGTLGDRPWARLAPHVAVLDADARAELCRKITASADAARGEARPILVELLGDASPGVREKAFAAFAAGGLAPGEERELEELLVRKAEDLRLAALGELAKLDDARLQASIERLLDAKQEAQRLGGLELLRRTYTADRLAGWCRERAEGYRSGRGELAPVERVQLEAITRPAPEQLTLFDALGLSPAAERTPLPMPRKRDVTVFTRAARELLLALDALVKQHAMVVVAAPTYEGDATNDAPLGTLRPWSFREPEDGDREASRAKMPLREVFEGFWRTRGAALRDADGCEGLRALLLLHRPEEAAGAGLLAKIGRLLGGVARPPLRFADVCALYLRWFQWLECPPKAPDFLLDVLEAQYAELGPENWRAAAEHLEHEGKGEMRLAIEARGLAIRDWRGSPAAWTPEQRARLWYLDRWYLAASPLENAELDLWLDLCEAGHVREADLCALLLQPKVPLPKNQYRSMPGIRELGSISGKRTYKGREIPARAALAVERVRRRLVDVELARGETPTEASDACGVLRWTGGLDVLVRASRVLTGGSLRRGMTAFWSSAKLGREEALSRIVQRTRPGDGETPGLLRQSLPVAEVGEERLVEIALFAPQWAAHAEHALGWKGLAEGVWWMHAHTKDAKWSVDQELRELWSAQTSERTPLSSKDLLDGAVDVAWFERVRAELGGERFATLLALAKFTSSGTGHTRAKLFASALLGREDRGELAARVREKRHQDGLRALGLVPLAEGDAAREADLLERYLLVQEFVRGAKQFGSQRQDSEKRAAAIALENLARTAGYPDPVRLEWAMERAALGELAAGSVTVKAGEVEVVLALDAEGEAEITARKGGKTLKAIPTAAKKDAAVKELVERKAAIGKQRVRMRGSLEQSMIRGDVFTGKELGDLFGHPVLAPLLARLVLVGEDVAGYPVEAGRALRGIDGLDVQVGTDTRLRLAHPFDMLATKQWSAWQRDCLQREIVQPFKQVFRELYVLTDAEREERLRSRRYAGHQVHPRQAMALLGTRGWVWHAEEGVRRVDHATGLAAWIEFLHAPFTPAEVEGLTIESVAFTKRGEWEVLPLDTIPPRLFSEVMRDVDLVVSVANRGAIDPEASASSIEARAALVRETCSLLGLANVRIDGRHAFIEGQLGNYSLHFGSGVVHKLPGGHLCIVPVHAQHRGRIFLPFADDDPKTAEILSKVLLLARDAEIKDPTILEQIRR